MAKKETIGDYGNSLCLLDAYQKAVNDQIIRDLTKAKQDTAKYKVMSDFKETPDGWQLLPEFDAACEAAFRHTISGWRVHPHLQSMQPNPPCAS